MPPAGEILIALFIFVLGGLASGLAGRLRLLVLVGLASLFLLTAFALCRGWGLGGIVASAVFGLVLQQATWFALVALRPPSSARRRSPRSASREPRRSA